MTRRYVITANLLAVSVVCGIVLVAWLYFSVRSHAEVRIDSRVLYPVSSVVDGDTFKVDIGQSNPDMSDNIITVRVLGINTPETVDPRRPAQCYGPEASHEAKELLEGHSVKLVFNPDREMKDKYGRYLAYVYRDDGLFYNESMIQDGYAKEYTVGTAYSLQAQFRALQKEAKAAKRGLWAACAK